jgi:hypothetical protein
MAGKVTLYVSDEDLWRRAREACGPGGLSNAVHECLRDWLERADVSAPPPSLLELARRLRLDADALVRAVESQEPRPRAPRRRRSRPRHARG